MSIAIPYHLAIRVSVSADEAYNCRMDSQRPPLPTTSQRVRIEAGDGRVGFVDVPDMPSDRWVAIRVRATQDGLEAFLIDEESRDETRPGPAR
jgi:hypothetical protein